MNYPFESNPGGTPARVEPGLAPLPAHPDSFSILAVSSNTGNFNSKVPKLITIQPSMTLDDLEEKCVREFSSEPVVKIDVRWKEGSLWRAITAKNCLETLETLKWRGGVDKLEIYCGWGRY